MYCLERRDRRPQKQGGADTPAPDPILRRLQRSRASAGAMVFNVPLALTARHNHCDECGAPSSANWVSMIFSKSAGGNAPLRKTPFTKNPGVPATPTLRPCSKSASILDLNLPLSRHD